VVQLRVGEEKITFTLEKGKALTLKLYGKTITLDGAYEAARRKA
jgi:hypothetical protein